MKRYFEEELEFLQQRKLPVPPFGAAYSINRGLWGTTIGGKPSSPPSVSSLAVSADAGSVVAMERLAALAVVVLVFPKGGDGRQGKDSQERQQQAGP